MKVIDVSYHQGVIDWQKVKKAGVEGAIIRAGYGKGNVDACFKLNVKNAMNAGLNLGIYWFSYATSVEMAKFEAEFCHNTIKEYKQALNLGVYFDWEYDSMKYATNAGVNCTKELITDMILAFFRRIDELGYKSGYYTNLDFQNNYISITRLKRYKKWFARYTDQEQKDCYIWQYSEKGKVNGINGNVDLDIYKTDAELAQEVIEGKYGNGEERKRKIEDTGHDYSAVQKLVNQKLQTKTNYKTYTVKSGDSLWAIAAAKLGSGARYTEIKSLNNLKSDIIHPGQVLKLPNK